MHHFLTHLSSSALWNMEQRRFLLRLLGINGREFYIQSHVFFTEPRKLSNIYIGHRCFINYQTFLDNNDIIVLEDNVCIAPRVSIYTTSHKIGSSDRRVGQGCYTHPVIIKRGCWIGGNTIILPGVKIGEGCVIGAGSLVRKDCEPNSLYAGNPARLVKYYESEEERITDGKSVCGDILPQ